MKQDSLFLKLTSRKFIISALSAIAGICALLFGENHIVSTVMGAMMVIVPSVVYCIMEGRIDAESAKSISGAITDAAQKLGADEQTLKTLEKVGDVAATLVSENQTST